MIPKQCIIIGGGSSIRQDLWNTPIEWLPIWQSLEGKFVITMILMIQKFISSISSSYMQEIIQLDLI